MGVPVPDVIRLIWMHPHFDRVQARSYPVIGWLVSLNLFVPARSDQVSVLPNRDLLFKDGRVVLLQSSGALSGAPFFFMRQHLRIW
ncbi:MAG TPA: hypothetical protein VFK31_05935 [Rhodanobacteraceae bacterium]|nr:hypothetical protein [Rhodanobacteraceae bacterium]